MDLCTYVGQWGTQFARALKELGVQSQITAVDGSLPALMLARANMESQGAQVEILKGDVLRDLEELPEDPR